MFGLVWIGLGLAFLSQALKFGDEDRSWIDLGIPMVISLFCLLLGARVFRNGFPRADKNPR
jgi:hypothetical protein